MRQMRHVIYRYLRTRRWQAVLRAARVLTGLGVAFLGVAMFLADPGSAVMSEADRQSQSALLVYSSVALLAAGFVIMVGPDKVNEIAKRKRGRT